MLTKTFRPAADLIITLLLWAYYFAAFVFFFFPAYSAAALFAPTASVLSRTSTAFSTAASLRI